MSDLSKLEAGANSLSSFNGYVGSEEHYDGPDNYEGSNDYDGDNYDDFISNADTSSASDHYDGYNGLIKSYIDEIKTGRMYIFTVTNLGKTVSGTTTWQACSFNLHSGYKVLFGATGQAFEVLAFGQLTNTATTVEGNTIKTETIGADGYYTELVYFSLYNPMRVVGFKIKTNDSDNLEGKVTIEPISPFRKLEQRFIYLSAHQNEQDFKDNVVTVKEGFDFNNQTKVSMSLTGGSSSAPSKMTITLVFGAVLNTAVALNRKMSQTGKKHRRRHPRRK